MAHRDRFPREIIEDEMPVQRLRILGKSAGHRIAELLLQLPVDVRQRPAHQLEGRALLRTGWRTTMTQNVWGGTDQVLVICRLTDIPITPPARTTPARRRIRPGSRSSRHRPRRDPPAPPERPGAGRGPPGAGSRDGALATHRPSRSWPPGSARGTSLGSAVPASIPDLIVFRASCSSSPIRPASLSQVVLDLARDRAAPGRRAGPGRRRPGSGHCCDRPVRPSPADRILARVRPRGSGRFARRRRPSA